LPMLEDTLVCLALDGFLCALGVHDYGLAAATDWNGAFEILFWLVLTYLTADACAYVCSSKASGLVWWLWVQNVPEVLVMMVGAGRTKYVPPSWLYEVIRSLLWAAIRTLEPSFRDAAAVTRADGWRPVHVAVIFGAPPGVVRSLAGAYPRACEAPVRGTGRLPLHEAVARGAALPVVRCLVDKYPAALERGAEHGRLPLHIASRFNASREVVQYLLHKCPEAIRGQDAEGWLPLHHAVLGRASAQLVGLLVDQYPGATGSQTNEGWLPLHVAARHATAEVVRLLATRAPSALKAKDGDGLLPLHAAATGAPVEVIDCLVDLYREALHEERKGERSVDPHDDAAHLASGTVIQRRRESKCPLGFAATGTPPNELKAKVLLLETTDGSLPLHCAVAGQAPEEVIRYLIGACRKALEVKKREGWLPLHLAVRYGAPLSVVDLFVCEYGEALELMTDRGHLPLHLAAVSASEQVVELLAERYPGALEMKDNEGWLPLHIAARYSSETGVKELVRRHPRGLEEKTNGGWLPLHVAAMSNATLKVVSFLAEAGPGAVMVKDNEGRLPVHVAALRASAEVAQYLREKSPADLTETEPDACQEDHGERESATETTLRSDRSSPTAGTEESTQKVHGASPGTDRPRMTRQGGDAPKASKARDHLSPILE
jgi:ankyrin repeat protein